MTTEPITPRCDNCRHYEPEPAPKLAGRCCWLIKQPRQGLPKWVSYQVRKPLVPSYQRHCDAWEPRP